MSHSGGHLMPGTVRRTTGPCSATADPGTPCGQRGEGRQIHEDGDLELYPGEAAGPDSKQLQTDPQFGEMLRTPIVQASLDIPPTITPAPSQGSLGHRVTGHGLGIPNVIVLLDCSVGQVPLPTVTAGTELGRCAALTLSRGRGQRAPWRTA